MRQIVVVALLAALCVARVSAHSWMVSPASRNGNQAVTGTGPCDAGPTTTRVQYNAGSTITVNYNTGGHGGSYIAAVVASSNLPGTGALTQTSPGVIAWQLASLTNPPATQTHSLTIPSDTPTGDYTIHYRWNNYYNCADIRVLNANTGGLGGSGGGSAAPDSSESNGSAAAVGVIGGLAIAAVILVMAVLYKKNGCRLSSGVAVFPGAASTSTTTAPSAARPAAARPAAARPVPGKSAPLQAVSVAPRGAASPRTMAAAVAMAGEPGESPLPPNWDTAVDDHGNVYYYHVHTNQVQWERPVA